MLLYSFTPSAGSKILIFSLLLNYMGCQSTVGDILSREIYTNTQSTHSEDSAQYLLHRPGCKSQVVGSPITALPEIDCRENIQ